MSERYYFGLVGSKCVEDPLGLPFDSDLTAFASAMSLADALSEVQPTLRGSTSVVLTRKGSVDEYYVSIN